MFKHTLTVSFSLPDRFDGSSPGTPSRYHSAQSTPMSRSPEPKQQIKYAQIDGNCDEDEDERPAKRTKSTMTGEVQAKDAAFITIFGSSSAHLPQNRSKFLTNATPTSHPFFDRDDPKSPHFQNIPRNQAFKSCFGTDATDEDTEMTEGEDKQAKINKTTEAKLNDLRKFSDSFKLSTPVPEDLVPILANEAAKRKENSDKGGAEKPARSFGQFDGACDEESDKMGVSKDDEVISLSHFLKEPEAPVEENTVSPSKSGEARPSALRRLSSFRKRGTDKVKELTSHVTKLRGASPSRSPRKPREERFVMNAPEADPNARGRFQTEYQKPRNTLTEANIKGLEADAQRGPSRGSEHSFGSMNVNLPGPRAPKTASKPLNAFAPYVSKQSLESTQYPDTVSEMTPQGDSSATTLRKSSTVPDATALPIHAGDALQEAKEDARKDLASTTDVPVESQNRPSNDGNENA